MATLDITTWTANALATSNTPIPDTFTGDVLDQVFKMHLDLTTDGYSKIHSNVAISFVIKEQKCFFSKAGDQYVYTFDPAKAVRFDIWKGRSGLNMGNANIVEEDSYMFTMPWRPVFISWSIGYTIKERQYFSGDGNPVDNHYYKNVFFIINNALLASQYRLYVVSDYPVEGEKLGHIFVSDLRPNQVKPVFEELAFASFKGIASIEGNGFSKFVGYRCNDDKKIIHVSTATTAEECDTECDTVGNCAYYSFEGTKCSMFSRCAPNFEGGAVETNKVSFDKLIDKSGRNYAELSTAKTELDNIKTDAIAVFAELGTVKTAKTALEAELETANATIAAAEDASTATDLAAAEDALAAAEDALAAAKSTIAIQLVEIETLEEDKGFCSIQ